MSESIKYLVDKIKLISNFFNKNDIFVVFLIILTSTASFGLGRLSLIETKDVPLNIASISQNLATSSIEGKYVASKNGTKYHLPWCSGAQRISEANKIWFETKEEAEGRGYTPAANCKGI